MPIIKSAIKKMQQDKKKAQTNKSYEFSYRNALKNIKKGKAKSVQDAYKALDRAAKKGVIHKKKASRLKSLASRLMKKK